MRLIAMLLSVVISTQVWAGTLPKPEGKVLLTLTGNIANTNADGKAVFDTASLEKLGMISFQTSSPGIMGVRLLQAYPCKN